MKFRSILLAEARGSMAGATFSRNGNSAYVRARATPVNPRSPSQTQSRESLNNVSSAWRSLTQPQRQRWVDLAKTVPYTNSLGESSFYSGFQLFMKCNLTVVGTGGSFIADAPASPPVFQALLLSAFLSEQDAVDPNLFSMNANYGAQPTDPTMVVTIEATNVMSAGKAFVAKNAYRTIRQIAPSTPSGLLDLSQYWTSIFGTPETSFIGSRVNMRARYISITTGFASPWLEFTTIIQEA